MLEEEKTQMIQQGDIFGLCADLAMENGFKDVMITKPEVKFNIGDYEVTFDYNQKCFCLVHKEYFARIIHAYFHGTYFTGDDAEWMKEDLIKEATKEEKIPIK